MKRMINPNPVASIYPNPVQRGNMLHANVKFKRAGTYQLEVIDAAGRIVSAQQINASSKNFVATFTTERTWTAGMFTIRITGLQDHTIANLRFVML